MHEAHNVYIIDVGLCYASSARLMAFFCAKSFITLFKSMLCVLAVLLETNVRGD